MTVQNGAVGGATGGGIEAVGATLTLSDCTIRDNSSGLLGGGVGANATGLTITDSTLSGNSASSRGGGLFYKGFVRTLLVTNSTISGNSANLEGGVFVDLECGSFIAGDCMITNSTIAENSSTSGVGGIQCISTNAVILTNTIVAQNTGGNCISTNMDSGGHNLDDDGSCPFTASGDLSNMPANLGPLQDNGGTTETHALLEGSAAIDAGDDGVCPPFDQRGVIRADGDGDSTITCDIGAYEHPVKVPLPFWPLAALSISLLLTGSALLASKRRQLAQSR